MDKNIKKDFWDNFRNPNGSYHIPIWLIVVGFFVNWLLGVGLLVARFCEEGGMTAYKKYDDDYDDDDDDDDDDDNYKKSRHEHSVEPPQPAKRKKVKKGPVVILTALGIIAIIAGIFGLTDSVSYLIWRIHEGGVSSYQIQYVAEAIIWIISGFAMILAGELMRRSAARRNKIITIVGDADHIHIDEIAEALPASRSKTEKYLQQCINYGIFGNTAYLDMRSDCLVVSGPAPMSKREQAEQAMAEAAAKRAEENMDEYAKILKELRDINDRIPGEEFSAKIERLEDLTSKIFNVVKEEPDKEAKMRKFVKYYLPTALKLLRQYEQLDAQGIEGKNISESKRQIEETMDTMIEAFEKQLDVMFAAENMDISADIAAMQNLMRADGLIDNGLTDKIE